ncbi:hypothetical protein DTO282E5_517 [Paecilomyces variotii]|nr:hypothetical protein DTO282E5_517 [Paecilomyces variotii]
MSSGEETQGDKSAVGEGAAKPFSLAFGGGPNKSGVASKKTSFNFQNSRATGPKTKAIPHRPQRLHEDDSDEDEHAPVHEEVTGFDTTAGGAITADDSRNKKQELVIKVESKNNWRDRPGVNVRRPKGKNLLPKEVQAQRQAEKDGVVAGNVETEGPNMSYGLTYAKPATITTEDVKNGDVPMVDADALAPGEEKKPLTQDEIALQALIRESQGDSERTRSNLVIESGKRPSEEEEEYETRYDETSSFRADVASRPDPASLDAYNAIPVEEFGAALLRGMGWKEGQPIGRGNYGTAVSATAKAPRVPERRPGFLGIGAKDISGGKGAEAEIGAWGKAAMRKGSRKKEGQDGAENTDGIYMPVLMRNPKTGESITEEEFKARQKAAKNVEEDWRDRRDRNLEKSGRDRERSRRDYDDDSDRYERRRNGSGRDRSRSSDDRDRRRKRGTDEDRERDDRRYYRDRDRDRDRERDRDRDRDRHRDKDQDRSHRDGEYRSSRHSSSTSSRHDRDRRRRDDYR